jgi:protein SCO1/2
MTRALAALLIILATVAAAPADLRGFGYAQHPGAALPQSATFHDESGAERHLTDFAGRPMILALGYFHCPNLCGLVRADLLDALRRTGMIAGRDYDLVALSIDPAETPADAREAKQTDMQHFDLPSDRAGWHYLTGDAAAIAQVSEAVGFRDRFDATAKQFLHPAGLVFATSRGVVSSYLLGVGYAPGDVRLAVARAADGTIARAALPVLLLCFHYDPTTGRYSLAIMKVLRLAAAVTVLTLMGAGFLMFRRGGRAA